MFVLSFARIDVRGSPMRFAGGPGLFETVLGKDAWIGHRLLIMQGERIGEESGVASGSIIAGNAANKAKRRFDEETITENRRLLVENGFS